MIVTITGADDGVDPRDLWHLEVEFPFVEWGILMSTSRRGTPRYPSDDWLARLSMLADEMIENHTPMPLSAHLCGGLARAALAGSVAEIGSRYYDHFQRVQLNGYQPLVSQQALAAVSRCMDKELILQCRSFALLDNAVDDAVAMVLGAGGDRRSSEAVIGLYATREYAAVSILLDPSGGTGLSGEWASCPKRWSGGGTVLNRNRYGIAGGIGPDNVRDALQAANRLGAGWIDMESGVRDAHDRFDLGRVRAVLERAKELKRP